MSAEIRSSWVRLEAPDLGSRRSLALLATRAMGRWAPEAVAWERARLHESSEARGDNCDVVFFGSERFASRPKSQCCQLSGTNGSKPRTTKRGSQHRHPPVALESQRLGDERERQDLITPGTGEAGASFYNGRLTSVHWAQTTASCCFRAEAKTARSVL